MPFSPERRSAVERARENWIRRLIDLSRRNNLLFYRDLKTGTLDLTACHPEAMTRLLAGGETIPLTILLPNAEERRMAACAQEIRRRAISNLEEKGLETLFLSFGMATWRPADEGRPPESPVLLVPVTIETRGREGRSLSLRRAGDVQANLVLLHTLETEHGISLSPESLVEVFEGDEEGETFDPTSILAHLTQVVAGIEGFAVTPRVVLSNFSFQKMAMVKDLRERTEEMIAHDMISAIAGDLQARQKVHGGRDNVDPKEFDRIPPENEFLILDTDSSQQKVVVSVLGSQDGVIHGPPGTGKSQTIANLVAALVAQGRRVLFVAQKRAALEVVLHRLDKAGLGHLALDLHGADVSRREIMKQLSQSLTLIRNPDLADATVIHRRLVDRRTRLNEHVKRLHTPRLPSGLSVYELQGRLLKLQTTVRSSVRWRGTDLDPLDADKAAAVKDLLAEAGGFSGLFLRTDPSTWCGSLLTDGFAAQRAIDLAARISEQWPTLLSSLTGLVAAINVSPPITLNDTKRLVSLLKDVANTLAFYSGDLFRQDLTSLSADLLAASRGTLFSIWAWCSKAAYRKALRVARALRRGGSQPARQICAEIIVAAEQQLRWKAITSSETIPCTAPGLENACRRLKALTTDITHIGSLLGRDDLDQIPLGDMARLFNSLSSDSMTPYRIPRLLTIERKIQESGAGAIIGELRRLNVDPELWPKILEHAWLSSCLDRAQAEEPALAGFHGRTHDQFVEEFCHLDRERLKVAAARVRRAHAERVIMVMNQYPDQEALVRREAEKKARHLPLRKLVALAPDVMTALRPCWMASPLSVSQLLGAERRYFDIVLFDEASQVLPEDAVPSLLRAPQVVVAGDRRQLPPTTFFAAGEDDEYEVDAPSATEGFESVLDLMSSFLEPWPLDWHYRSRDEALIAFSNRHIYGDRLVTFPGAGGAPSISHVLVNQVPGQDGQEESVSLEVARVVDLVIEHATRQLLKRPEEWETLGVIAMGLPHVRRIEAALDQTLILRPDLDLFFDQSHEERFFVKNLERVQGDERDAIILTVGYGKDRSGRLLYRFGPLLTEGGERRLNVAITRARYHMTIVSAFSHYDMDPGRSSARGIELLRLYLQYAVSNGSNLGDTGRTVIPLNAFEADVFDTLMAKGMALLPQWGASKYRMDMVAQHPQRPGRFVLAIECDGASYHAAPTARDRDRLRQQHLEALGWRFHRIWSTDWFMRREEEIERALSSYQLAVLDADNVDAGGRHETSNGPVYNLTPSAPSLKPEPTPALRRGPRPIRRGDSITDYREKDLDKLVRWILFDGCLHTDEELVEEMMRELGFQRRGPRIESAIRSAIARVRQGHR